MTGSNYSTCPVECIAYASCQKKRKKKTIRGTVYLPNCHDSQCSEAYAVWCSVPVHCAANERETPDNAHYSHFILCDHKDAVSIKASQMMTRMG